MKLREYLDKNGLKRAPFARKLGVSTMCLFKYMRNNYCPKYIQVAIKHLTGNEVKMSDWGPNPLFNEKKEKSEIDDEEADRQTIEQNEK